SQTDLQNAALGFISPNRSLSFRVDFTIAPHTPAVSQLPRCSTPLHHAAQVDTQGLLPPRSLAAPLFSVSFSFSFHSRRLLVVFAANLHAAHPSHASVSGAMEILLSSPQGLCLAASQDECGNTPLHVAAWFGSKHSAPPLI